MEIYQVAFIGHRRIDAYAHLEDRIEQIARDLIRQKEYVEFYVGRNGDFDIMAASAIKRTQRALGHENSSLILVQPYPMKDDEYYENYYDELAYPISRHVHPKAAITQRNQWMIDHAQLLIAFVEDGRKGGALTALKYSNQKGIPILNRASQDEINNRRFSNAFLI